MADDSYTEYPIPGTDLSIRVSGFEADTWLTVWRPDGTGAREFDLTEARAVGRALIDVATERDSWPPHGMRNAGTCGYTGETR